MSKVVNLDDYRKKPVNHKLVIHQMAIDVHKQIVEMHDKSVLNYEQHKILLLRLSEILNKKGDKDE
jgi:hypothetical protein